MDGVTTGQVPTAVSKAKQTLGQVIIFFWNTLPPTFLLLYIILKGLQNFIKSTSIYCIIIIVASSDNSTGNEMAIYNSYAYILGIKKLSVPSPPMSFQLS